MLEYDRIDILEGNDENKTEFIERVYALSLLIFFR